MKCEGISAECLATGLPAIEYFACLVAEDKSMVGYGSLLRKASRLLSSNQFQRLKVSRGLLTQYDTDFKESVENPVEFWAKLSENVTWFKPWNKVLDTSLYPSGRW